jgi:hypothetical protein
MTMYHVSHADLWSRVPVLWLVGARKYEVGHRRKHRPALTYLGLGPLPPQIALRKLIFLASRVGLGGGWSCGASGWCSRVDPAQAGAHKQPLPAAGNVDSIEMIGVFVDGVGVPVQRGQAPAWRDARRVPRAG